MKHEDKQFIPEAVDERVDYLLELSRRPQQPATFIEPETHLIHDLANFTKEYQSSHDHVWQRLQAHVYNSKQAEEPENAKRDAFHYTQEKSPKMQQNLSLGYQYRPRPITRTLAIIAAMLVAALVVGSTIAILTLGHRPGNNTGGHDQQHHAAPASPTPTFIGNQYCNMDWQDELGWNALCAAHQLTPINITKTFTSKIIYTINAGYADSNELFFYTTMQAPATTPPTPQYPNIIISDVKTAQGTDLPLLNRPGARDPNNPYTIMYSLTSFSTAELPQTRSTLDLQLTLTDNNAPPSSGGAYTLNLSLPFHKARIANLNQTVTANNIPITLSRVVVGGSSTWIYLRNPQLADIAKHFSPKGTFDSSVYHLTAGNWSSTWSSQNAFLHVYASALTQPLFDTQALKEGLLIMINDDLFNKHGNWTFTISKDTIEGATSDWVFYFTVPN